MQVFQDTDVYGTSASQLLELGVSEFCLCSWTHVKSRVCLREPAQAEVNIGMKANYYNGAADGTIRVFKDIPEPLDQLLTPNRNTILHIHLASLIEGSEPSTTFVEEILRMYP